MLVLPPFVCRQNHLFCVLQVATLIAVYANWGFARIKGMGWGWAGVIWLYSLVTYVPLDLLKFAIRYVLSGKAWDNLLENKVCLILFPFRFSTALLISNTESSTFGVAYAVIKMTDCLHHKERLWQRRKRSTVGRRTEDPPWPSATGNLQPFQ